ncbi:peptidoglycan-binding protein [Actibacterium mucosum KCTC 23349]|uniref:Peptidoglycan-binding protein n=1 Tax=Actibacterium mucosum KCTC 23349 TaxID=1454373 RepID=A0A037ZLF3_9RHOB|nr:L,D-transpeptidase family protein [Actibacterium mucosum]KAJ56894.1 peptidoglycan-binding protein [Actibacterium mucosum KCTC 23349]
MTFSNLPAFARPLIAGAALSLAAAIPAFGQVTAFKQAVAEAASSSEALSEFYRTTNYEAIWTGKDDKARRRAFVKALASVDAHGLPSSRYSAEMVRELLKSAKSSRDLGRVEVELSQMFLQYAQDLQSGVLDGTRLIEGIKRKPSRRDGTAQLVAFSKSAPNAYFKSLAPKSPEYKRLMAEKQRLERLLGAGGWGEGVPKGKLEPGDSGAKVVALRNRLIAMGYMKRSPSQSYDSKLQKAVQAFQIDHGLLADGVAGDATIAALNVPVQTRLEQVIVAMERERWLGDERGQRHILVNITDFHARIMENGQVAFKTRSVVGANTSDRRTPEFSDIMEHMVINPTWNVPRSIATKEYLPMLKKNPQAVSHLRITDARGQLVDRANTDFTQYSTRNFPFDIKQPPSRGNALGLVKFMFPNRHNIYLHDTPHKSLFGREARAFSHGCIRLNDPFDFAYELLSKQTANPQSFFAERLNTGRETTVPLEKQVPVHIIYRTAFTEPKGRVQFRTDIYGRDAKLFDALSEAGVVLRAVRS